MISYNPFISIVALSITLVLYIKDLFALFITLERKSFIVFCFDFGEVILFCLLFCLMVYVVK